MTSILTVVTAAADRSLLTQAEARAAIGDASADVTALIARTSAAIVRACMIAAAGVVPPTLRLETLSEQFRLKSGREQLALARFPIVSLDSVTEDGTALDLDYDCEFDAGSGLVYRLSSDTRICWPCGRIVFDYSAGWETVPDDLKLAASKLAAVFCSEGSKVDQGLKRESIPGVIDREWWVGPSGDPAIPVEVMDLLKPYVNRCMIG